MGPRKVGPRSRCHPALAQPILTRRNPTMLHSWSRRKFLSVAAGSDVRPLGACPAWRRRRQRRLWRIRHGHSKLHVASVSRRQGSGDHPRTGTALRRVVQRTLPGRLDRRPDRGDEEKDRRPGHQDHGPRRERFQQRPRSQSQLVRVRQEGRHPQHLGRSERRFLRQPRQAVRRVRHSHRDPQSRTGRRYDKVADVLNAVKRLGTKTSAPAPTWDTTSARAKTR